MVYKYNYYFLDNVEGLFYNRGNLFSEGPMAKPRNTEERNRIERIAFRILTDKGVSDTSFADIALKANVTRSLVQHYFPKKDIFIEDFINRCLSEISDLVDESEYVDSTNPIEEIYAVGFIAFEFLLYNRQMENLKQDILRTRDNTTLIVDTVIMWAMDHLENQPDEIKDKVATAIRYAMGGAFEDIFSSLDKGEPIDGYAVSEMTIRLMNAALDFPSANFQVPDRIPKEWLTEQVKQLNQILLGS